MSTANDKLAQASQILREAVAADSSDRGAEALPLYEQALSLMLSVVRTESSPQRKERWLGQVQQYMTRAEQLKQALASTTAPAAADPAGSSPTPATSASLLPRAAVVQACLPHPVAALRAAIGAVCERFTPTGEPGLRLLDLNAIQRVSGDPELSQQDFDELCVSYGQCGGRGALSPGSFAAFMLMIGEREPQTLARILAAHGYDEARLRALSGSDSGSRGAEASLPPAVVGGGGNPFEAGGDK